MRCCRDIVNSPVFVPIGPGIPGQRPLWGRPDADRYYLNFDIGGRCGPMLMAMLTAPFAEE